MQVGDLVGIGWNGVRKGKIEAKYSHNNKDDSPTALVGGRAASWIYGVYPSYRQRNLLYRARLGANKIQNGQKMTASQLDKLVEPVIL